MDGLDVESSPGLHEDQPWVRPLRCRNVRRTLPRRSGPSLRTGLRSPARNRGAATPPALCHHCATDPRAARSIYGERNSGRYFSCPPLSLAESMSSALGSDPEGSTGASWWESTNLRVGSSNLPGRTISRRCFGTSCTTGPFPRIHVHCSNKARALGVRGRCRIRSKGR
jgi:hypothetical protein